MMNPKWYLPCLMTTMLAPWGACTMEEAIPDATQDLAHEAQPAVLDPGLRLVAEELVPTEDGQASYRFRFERMLEGPIVTTIETPLDYPRPIVPTDCALDTYLRVVSQETIVPSELIEHCLSPAERAEFGLPEEGPVTVRAGHLQQVPGAPLGYAPVPASALCFSAGFQARVDELEEMAAFQPYIPTSCELPCEYGIYWTPTECNYVDKYGYNLGMCTIEHHQQVLNLYGQYGHRCVDYGEWQCQWEPDPACAHTEHVFGDYGPYSSWWQRSSNGQSKTSRALVEIISCNQNEGPSGWWRMKKNSGDPYGPHHNQSWAANTHSSLSLSAGWDANDKWRGWDFQIRAEGSNFRVISAWIEMEGKSRNQCPIKI